MRGRRPDDPATQAAKGHPGKRRTRVEIQMARAAEIAALLSSAPGESSDPLAPPALLNDARCAPALAVWREYAPRLARQNLFGDLDRHTLAMFCVYTAEYAEAHMDVLNRGYVRPVKTVSGDKMDRVNPSAERRDAALKFVLEISKRFGLTPLDRFNLTSLQRNALATSSYSSNSPSSPAAEGDLLSPVGAMAALDSPPPGDRPN